MTRKLLESETLTSIDVDSLIQLLEGQAKFYEQLKLLSAQQGALVADGRADELLSILASRQSLISELSTLNSLLTPYGEKWAQVTAQLDDSQRRRISELTTRISQLRDQIVAQDESDFQALTVARKRVGREIKQVATAGAAVAAYRSAATVTVSASASVGESRFTDQQV